MRLGPMGLMRRRSQTLPYILLTRQLRIRPTHTLQTRWATRRGSTHQTLILFMVTLRCRATRQPRMLANNPVCSGFPHHNVVTGHEDTGNNPILPVEHHHTITGHEDIGSNVNPTETHHDVIDHQHAAGGHNPATTNHVITGHTTQAGDYESHYASPFRSRTWVESRWSQPVCDETMVLPVHESTGGNTNPGTNHHDVIAHQSVPGNANPGTTSHDVVAHQHQAGGHSSSSHHVS